MPTNARRLLCEAQPTYLGKKRERAKRAALRRRKVPDCVLSLLSENQPRKTCSGKVESEILEEYKLQEEQKVEAQKGACWEVSWSS